MLVATYGALGRLLGS